MFNKLRILLNSIIGYFIKWRYDLSGERAISPLKKSREDPSIIISLTSYGRRISKSIVYYTLVSLFRQNKRPSRIILWLDESWIKKTIPSKITRLTLYGLEIRFFKDIKSYKKLLPTLIENPDSIIITVDDDMIYHKNLIKSLVNGYKTDGNIQCTVASCPLDHKKKLLPYNSWRSIYSEGKNDVIVPIGVGGVLYPPNSLSKEVLNEGVFTTLAPRADDLWFWAMARLNGSKHSFVKLNGSNYSFDAIYQFFHKGSALTHSNSGECYNDVQLNNILKAYPTIFNEIN